MFVHEVIRSEIVSVPFDSKNLNMICPIDQFDAQDFNINECGFIRNDISKLARAASQSEYDALMRKIGMVDAKYNIKDGMSIKEAMDMVKPRYAQSACEIAEFSEYISRMQEIHKSYDSVELPDNVGSAADKSADVSSADSSDS